MSSGNPRIIQGNTRVGKTMSSKQKKQTQERNNNNNSATVGGEGSTRWIIGEKKLALVFFLQKTKATTTPADWRTGWPDGRINGLCTCALFSWSSLFLGVSPPARPYFISIKSCADARLFFPRIFSLSPLDSAHAYIRTRNVHISYDFFFSAFRARINPIAYDLFFTSCQPSLPGHIPDLRNESSSPPPLPPILFMDS